MKLELAVAGIGLSIAAAGAGTAYVSNKAVHTGRANKMVTISSAALGVTGVGIAKMLHGSSQKGDIFIALAYLSSAIIGASSLAFAGGSMGADLLNLGQRT